MENFWLKIASRDIHLTGSFRFVFPMYTDFLPIFLVKSKSEIFANFLSPTNAFWAPKSLCAMFFDDKNSYKYIYNV